MKKQNENIGDLLGQNLDSAPDMNTIIGSGKKKKKRSLVVQQDEQEFVGQQALPKDDIQSGIISESQLAQFGKQEPAPVKTVPQEIVIPTPIAEDYQNQVIQNVKEQKQVQITRQISQNRAQQKQKIVTEILNQQVKQDLEQIGGQELPEDVNYVEVEEVIDTANNDIPGTNDIDIVDIEIHKTDKKDKTGYYKTVVNIKKDNIPEQVSTIASYVKKMSNGVISPRVCDLRVIGNTNKTQLRGKSMKLSSATVVFKPNPKKLKVNKGTRFMISVPDNYTETGNLIVYIQESRAKTIMEISSRDFPDVTTFNKYLAKRIAEFYTVGYIVTVQKLELRNTKSPLMSLISKVVRTHEYRAKPYTENNMIHAIDFYTKSAKNQWLIINVYETDINGLYNVIAKNKIDKTWTATVTKEAVPYQKLEDNILNILQRCYDRDWTSYLGIDDEDTRFMYLYGKLKHSKLREALYALQSFNEENPNFKIDLRETLNKQDVAEALKSDSYDAEAAIYKTSNTDYIILTYLAHQIKSGDKRRGKDYISSDEYHEKYDVSDRRAGEERVKEDRNYNARKYMFQIEYSVNGKVHVYRDFKIDDIMKATGILSDEIKFPKTKY